MPLYLLNDDDVRFIRSLRRWQENLRGPGVRSNSKDGATIGVSGNDPPPQEKGLPFRCQLIEVHYDYLVCRPIDVTDSTDTLDFVVAKPWQLRRTPTEDGRPDVDGEEYTFDFTDEQSRTVTRESDSYQEEQVVTPEYVIAQGEYVGDEITVQECSNGLVIEDDDGNELIVQFEDCNRAGRAWALR